jgi:F0F1-type ATP synthase assembly protein I
VASSDDRESWRSALAVASVGIEMAVAVAFGWWLGSRLDELLGTAPWMMYLWLALGIAAAFRGLWHTARKHWPKDGAP